MIGSAASHVLHEGEERAGDDAFEDDATGAAPTDAGFDRGDGAGSDWQPNTIATIRVVNRMDHFMGTHGIVVDPIRVVNGLFVRHRFEMPAEAYEQIAHRRPRR